MLSSLAINKICFLALLLICPKLFFAQSRAQSTADWVAQMFESHRTSDLLPEFEDSYGVVFRDLNNDQLADLYIVRFRNLNRLFINQGAGKPFRDMTIESGLGGNLMPRGKQNLELGASAADFDNNGWPDVLIAGWGVASSLFYQSKNLQFKAMPLNSILGFHIDANVGIWSDVNSDGNLDLLLTDEHNCNHLLLNSGFGKFHLAKNNFGIDSTQATSQGAAFADVDKDGHADLYICNWFAPDMFYKNMNGKQFQRVKLPIAHLTDSLNSNGATFGDIDNDGDLDLLVTDRDGGSRLYRNDINPADTAWHFSDITRGSGLENTFPAYGSIIADLDNNGWQDIFFTNIGPNLLFLNEGSGQFHLAFKEPFPFISMKKKYSTGSAVADFDNDGDLDLFVANKDTQSVFYRNPSNSHNFLRFVLRGVKSNLDAIGSKIWLYEEIRKDSISLRGYREISGGSGYLSFSEPVVHFGVKSNTLYRALVQFPSGTKMLKKNLNAGSTYLIEELGGFQRTAILSYRWLVFTIGSENFWINALLFCFMVAVVIGFIYFSIVRYGWKNKQTAWFSISILVVLYILFIVQSGENFLTIILYQLSALLILMLISGIFMEKIRRLEKQRSGARELIRNFTRELIFIKDNKELHDRLVRTIHKAMNASFCLLMGVRDSEILAETQSGDVPARIEKLKMEEELKDLLLHQPFIAADKVADLIPQLHAAETDLIIPLTRNDKLLALLLLGKPATGKEYHSDDLSMLQILANQAAIAMENNIYIEEAKELIRKVTEAEVQKKYVRELEEKNESLQNLYRTLKETQSQLIQSEKMASMGQLVAGVAHELNNPISFIYANMKELENYISAIEEVLQVLLGNLNKVELQQQLPKKIAQLQEKYDLQFIQKDVHALINESAEGGRRVKEIVQNLRNFSRLDEGDVKSVDLHEGLNSTLLLLNNEIKNRIEIIKEFGELPKVECHPGQINQVFMNILLNAIQAIEGDGRILISTKTVNRHVQVIIKDSGKGIPEDVKNKVFDPFFTTKPVGKGTGLGLSISYNIIKNHNGEIEMESEPGKGTEFRIKLPVKMSTTINAPGKKGKHKNNG
jgi:signal transduction histidine kinase